MRLVKCQPVLLASEGLTEAEHLLPGWQIGVCCKQEAHFLPHRPLSRAVWASSQHSSWLSWSAIQERRRRRPPVFYAQALEVTCHYFLRIQWVIQVGAIQCGRGVHKHECQGVRNTRAIVEAGSHYAMWFLMTPFYLTKKLLLRPAMSLHSILWDYCPCVITAWTSQVVPLMSFLSFIF